MARSEARRTLSYVSSSPVSRMTFSGPALPSGRRQAAFVATISAEDLSEVSARNAPRSDDHRRSHRPRPPPRGDVGELHRERERRTGTPCRRSRPSPRTGERALRRRDEVRVDADGRDHGTDGSSGPGGPPLVAHLADLARGVLPLERRQVAHRNREPDPATFVAFLIDLFPSDAARSSSATLSTVGGRRSPGIRPATPHPGEPRSWAKVYAPPDAPRPTRSGSASPVSRPGRPARREVEARRRGACRRRRPREGERLGPDGIQE